MNSKVKKTLSIVVDVIIILFVVFAVLVTILAFTASSNAQGVPSIGNVCVLSVKSDSMKGDRGFSQGDLIFGVKVSDEEARNLQVDDVITFYVDLDGNGEKELNTHRIIARSESGGFVRYTTKGDNNEYQDWYTSDNTDVLSVWKGAKLPGMGNFIDFLQSSTGFFVLIVLPLIVFFGYELFNFIRTIVKLRNNGKRQISAEEEELIKKQAVEEYRRQMEAEANKGASDDESEKEE